MKATEPKQNSLIMIRHAQSEWNRQDRFSGWANPQLTEEGRKEAILAGRRLAAAGIRFDIAFSSRLGRALDTGRLVLDYSRNADIRIERDWRLNERHYGALQGRNKTETGRTVGEAQLRRWRRGYLDRPPAMAANDARHPLNEAKWNDIPREQIPNGENLEQTRTRAMAFWQEQVQPQIASGRSILIASHGNTLRALLMALDNMTIHEVESFEIPTGVPIILRLDAAGRPNGWHYLGASRHAARDSRDTGMIHSVA